MAGSTREPAKFVHIRTDAANVTELRSVPTVRYEPDQFLAVSVQENEVVSLVQTHSLEGCGFGKVRTAKGYEGWMQLKHLHHVSNESIAVHQRADKGEGTMLKATIPEKGNIGALVPGSPAVANGELVEVLYFSAAGDFAEVRRAGQPTAPSGWLQTIHLQWPVPPGAPVPPPPRPAGHRPLATGLAAMPTMEQPPPSAGLLPVGTGGMNAPTVPPVSTTTVPVTQEKDVAPASPGVTVLKSIPGVPGAVGPRVSAGPQVGTKVAALSAIPAATSPPKGESAPEEKGVVVMSEEKQQLWSQVKDQQDTIAMLSREIAGLRSQLVDSNTMSQGLVAAQMKEQQDIIMKLSSEVTRLRDESQDAQKARTDPLMQQVQEQHAVIAQLSHEVDAQRVHTGPLVAQVHEQQDIIAQLSEEIGILRNEAAESQALVTQPLQYQVCDQQDTIARLTGELDTLREQVMMTERKQTTQTLPLTWQVKDQQDVLQALSDEVTTLRTQMLDITPAPGPYGAGMGTQSYGLRPISDYDVTEDDSISLAGTVVSLGPEIRISEMPIVYPFTAPFSQVACGANIALSDDGYMVSRVKGSRQSMALGSLPLERQEQGLYFEVEICSTLDGWVGGLGMGVTHTSPKALKKVPDKAWRVPMTFMAGYWGCTFLDGKERGARWRGDMLKAGDHVGILVTGDGNSDLITFVNGQAVAKVDGAALFDAGMKHHALHPIVDVFAATSSIRLVPQSHPPPPPWDFDAGALATAAALGSSNVALGAPTQVIGGMTAS